MASKGAQVESALAGYLDKSGNPLASGKLYTYEAGTSTPAATYIDQNKTIAHANPIILDSQGQKLIFADGLFKFEIRDANNNLIETRDNLQYFFVSETTTLAEVISAVDSDGITMQDDGGNAGLTLKDGGNIGIKEDTNAATAFGVADSDATAYASSINVTPVGSDVVRIRNLDSSAEWVGIMMEANNGTPAIARLITQRVTANETDFHIQLKDSSASSTTVTQLTLSSEGDLTLGNSVVVGNLTMSGNTLQSTSGHLNLTPVAGSNVIIDSHWGFDGTTLVGLTDSNSTISAYSGRNVTIESVTFSGGVIDSVTNLTMSGTLDLGTNTVSDGIFTGTWNFDANTLFVDSVNNVVGIKTNSPNSSYAMTVGPPGLVVSSLSGSNGLVVYRSLGSVQTQINADSNKNYYRSVSLSGVEFHQDGTPFMTVDSSRNITLSSSLLYIDNSNGFVGVNTTSPSTFFETRTDSSTGNEVVSVFAASNGTDFLDIRRSAANFEVRTTSNMVIEADHDNDGASTTIVFKTDGSSALTIDSSQNVIANNTLQGTTLTDGTASLNLGSLSSVSNITMSGTLDLGTNTISDGVLTGSWNFDSNTLYVDSGNNRIGIGTASPSYQLEISGAEGVNITGSNARLYLEGQRVLEDISSGTRLDFAESYTGVFHRATNSYFGQSSTVDTARWINLTTVSESAYQRFEVYSVSSSHSPFIELVRSSGTTAGTLSQTTTNDVIGRIDFKGVNNANSDEHGAIITSTQTAASGSKVPANLVLRTFSSSAENSNQLYLSSDGNVGVGLSNPSTTFDVRGEIVNSDGSQGVKLTYSGGNTTGVIDTYGNHDLEFRANNNFAMAIDTSGQVGIGVLSPGRTLEINATGGASFEVDSITSGNATVIFGGYSTNTNYLNVSGGAKITLQNHDNTDGNYSSIAFLDNGGQTVSGIVGANISHANNEGDLIFLTRPSGGSLSHVGMFDSDGNFLVGDTSSISKMVLGSGTFTIKNSNTDSNGLKIFQDTSDHSKIYNHFSGNLSFGTGNTQQMTIDSNGNVGIGTNSPSGKLNVVTSAFGVSGKFSDNTNSTLFIRHPSINVIDFNTGSASQQFTFSNNGSESMRINSNGNVGIGSYSSLDCLLTVSDSSQDLQARVGSLTAGIDPFVRWQGKNVADTSNAFCDLRLFSDERVFTIYAPNTSGPTNRAFNIDSSGQVGIGVTDPGAILDVRSGDLDVSNGTYGVTLSYSAGNTTGVIDGYGNHDVELRGNGSEVARVKSDGEFNVLTKFDNGERTYRINTTSDADNHFITAHSYLGTRGGVMLVEPGSYSMNDAVTISNNGITIRGSGTGANGTKLNATSSSSAEDMFSVSGSDITFENIEFDATSSGYGVYLVDYSGSGQITFKNCIFREGGTACVRIQSGYALFEQCIFEVGDDSGDIGIENTGGRTKVIGCDFDADLDGTGKGIQHTSGYIWVSNCYFNDLDIAIDADRGYAEIYQNFISNCDTAVYCDPSANSTTGLMVHDNRFRSCNTRGVYIEAYARECQIKNNIFSQQSGTSCVEITGPGTVDVSGNTMKECSCTYGIYINDSKGSHGFPMSIKVDNNQFTEFESCTYAIYVNSPSPNSVGFGLGRTTSISNNQMSAISDNGNVTGIYTLDDGAVICNNIMDHFHCEDASATLKFIDCDGGNMTINNNVIFSDSNYNTNSTIKGIEFGGSGTNTTVVGNTIEISTDSGNNTTGIYEIGSCPGSTIVGNTIAVTVTGAGTGNAFNISETEGVAGLNDYSQSDAVGTLSISSGVVVDNNG